MCNLDVFFSLLHGCSFLVCAWLFGILTFVAVECSLRLVPYTGPLGASQRMVQGHFLFLASIVLHAFKSWYQTTNFHSCCWHEEIISLQHMQFWCFSPCCKGVCLLLLPDSSVSQLLWPWDVVADLDCELGPLGLHREQFDETHTLPQLFCMLSSHGSQ